MNLKEVLRYFFKKQKSRIQEISHKPLSTGPHLTHIWNDFDTPN
tara:strand:+ start:323 stop:454 length:132 start_codon:yes stop_codon:yes gene_type:complete